MKFKFPWEWGDIVYIVTDEDQYPYEVVGLIMRPGDQLMLELSHQGDIVVLFPFQVTKEKGIIEHIGLNSGSQDPDE